MPELRRPNYPPLPPRSEPRLEPPRRPREASFDLREATAAGDRMNYYRQQTGWITAVFLGRRTINDYVKETQIIPTAAPLPAIIKPDDPD